MLLSHSPSCDVNSGISSLTIPDNVHLFTPAVLIIYNYIALNASCLATYIARLLSLL
jgi:hypothetical protein